MYNCIFCLKKIYTCSYTCVLNFFRHKLDNWTPSAGTQTGRLVGAPVLYENFFSNLFFNNIYIFILNNKTTNILTHFNLILWLHLVGLIFFNVKKYLNITTSSRFFLINSILKINFLFFY